MHPEAPAALRPWGARDTDAAALAAAWADPEVARWNPVPDDASESAAAAWIGREGERRDRGLAVDLVVTVPGQPDTVLGEVGLALVEQERRWAEVGYWIVADARGQGLAISALTMFSRWALKDLPIVRLFARTHPNNPAAGRVVERAGFARSGEMPNGTTVWVLDA